MACMICCPCSRRSCGLLAGIVDLVLGSAGLAAVGFLLYIISTEIEGVRDDPTSQERFQFLSGLYWSVMLSYIFPSTITLLAGIFIICAVAQNCDWCAIISLLLSVIMIFGCGGILLILYVTGIEYQFLIPLIFATVMHTYFTCVIVSFRSNDLKARRTV